jgi:hypothetical protein
MWSLAKLHTQHRMLFFTYWLRRLYIFLWLHPYFLYLVEHETFYESWVYHVDSQLNLLPAVICVAVVLVPLMLMQVTSHPCHNYGLLSVLDLLFKYNQVGSLWRHSPCLAYWSVAYCLNSIELFNADICCKNSIHPLHHFAGFQLHG